MSLAAWLAGALLAFGMTLLGARAEERNGDHVSKLLLSLFAATGASIAILLPSEMPFWHRAAISLLGGLLLAGAFLDRQIGMSPDWVSAPVLALALAVGTILQPWLAHGFSPLIWGLAGLVAHVVINLFWIAADRATGGRMVPPPADLVAIILPALIFGFSFEISVFYVACSLVLLLCLRIPQVAAIFTSRNISDEMRAEITDDEGRQAIAALALLYPAIWLLLLRAAALA